MPKRLPDVPLRAGYDRPLAKGESPAFDPGTGELVKQSGTTISNWFTISSDHDPSRIARDVVASLAEIRASAHEPRSFTVSDAFGPWLSPQAVARALVAAGRASADDLAKISEVRAKADERRTKCSVFEDGCWQELRPHQARTVAEVRFGEGPKPTGWISRNGGPMEPATMGEILRELDPRTARARFPVGVTAEGEIVTATLEPPARPPAAPSVGDSLSSTGIAALLKDLNAEIFGPPRPLVPRELAPGEMLASAPRYRGLDVPDDD